MWYPVEKRTTAETQAFKMYWELYHSHLSEDIKIDYKIVKDIALKNADLCVKLILPTIGSEADLKWWKEVKTAIKNLPKILVS